ncbi:MAG: helix-turn-helix domain-containing protein [Candidatus Omnitrophica bacterium]|nr:helix-turn-helix domain-containing protein [Candidatus Omnitrophota bacterium]MBU1128829.1 helix-turn-helix domain-containing protein [Candidatus Omnitrophota bacterium]MBU1657334.1 helix-turn-helix domain-containing protein [Candidatus Omnitrophota bacterium]MBU1783778.1 helix-turn-helix domain-containing protein [Candidatus Omnitrophota bacterium]MBU1852129.1 helix-turn-helix domain-containing protein [Candidatus Omnitrophota bacterium]
MASQMMTVDEVAKYLKIKVVTIYKHAQQGKLPAFKVGSSWRFKKSTIDNWIEKQEKKTI